MASNKQTFVAEVNLNGRPAINNLDLLQKSIKNLTKEAKRLEKLGKNDEALKTRDKMEEVKKVVAATKDEIKRVDSAFTTAGKSVKGLENALKLAVEKWQRLTDAGERNKMALRIREIKTELNKMNSTLDVTANKSRHAFGALAQRAAEYTGMYISFNRLRQIITNAIQGNLKLSDSISDIQKVSGLSEDAVKGLVTQIEKLDSRNSPEVLNNMAYAAGKLGIKGAENLLGFTRAADKLNVALKEYLGDGADGVVKLMKFANVMGTSDQYGVEQALLKTGSALNYMTQSTAAAADYMIEFASRFGPIARQANMTEGDVIGLASALDALSVNNEEAATTLQRFVIKLLSSPKSVSKALGMDAEESKQLVETGRSIELVEQALGKLSERAEKYGVSGITSVIGDIGSKGQAQRLIKTLATLANNTEMVHDYVVMANGAFEKGTSVIDEYNIKNQNAAAIMERMKNSWEKMMVNSENVGAVKELAQELYDMSMELQQSTYWMTTLKVAINGLFVALKGLVWLLPSVLSLLAGMGISKIVVGIISAVRALGALIVSLRTATLTWKTFDIAMKSNVIGMIASVVALLVSLIWRWVEVTQEAVREAEEFNNKIKGLTSSLEDYHTELYKEQRAMDQLFARAKAANEKTDEKKRLIAEINTKYGKYLDNLLTEKSTIDEITKAQDQANNSLRQNIALKVKQNKMEELAETFATKGGTALESFRSGVEKTGLSTEDIYKAQQDIQDLLKQNYGKAGYGGPNQATVSILKELAKQDDRWNFVINNRKGVGSMQDFLRASKARGQNYYGTDPFSTAQREAAYKREQEMVNANRQAYQGIYDYVASVIEVTNAEKKVNDLYAPMIGDLESRLNKQEKENDTEDTTTVLEDFSKENAAAERERLKLEREQLQMLEKEVGGMGALIESFYNKRAAAIDEMYQNKEITGMQRDRMQAENKVDKAYAQNAAWRMMLGEEGSPELWTEQLNVMKNQVVTSSEQYGKEMQQVWTDIGTKNLADIGERLQRFGTKMTGGMKKTISVNQKEIEKSGATLLEQVRKDMERYDYAEQAKTKFLGILQQMYLFRTKFEDGITEGFADANEAARAGMDELVAMYDKLFNLDVNPDGSLTEKGLEQFRDMLRQTKHLSTDMAESSVEELQVLFYQTVKLGEATTEAIKRQVDRQKKIIDERWKRDPRKLAGEQAQNEQQQTGGLAATISGKWGIQSTVETKDAEIELYALRLQAATDYYNYLKEQKADQRLLDEQAQKMMELELALQTKLGERISALQQLFVDSMNTLPELGTALGEAFSKTDPEDRAQAFQDALKNMVQSLGEATKKMILEWVKQRIQESIQQKLMVAETTQAEAQKASAVIGAEQAIATAKQAIGQQSLVTQATQSAESLSTSAAETTGEVNLGIASGAAKTIAKLGWWGIPLVAVITALLNGLLSWALGSLFKSKETSSTQTKDTTQTLRLVKGMLTYDEGNVQDFRQAREGGAYTVMGADGRIYSAHKQSELTTGIIRRPTATLVNGQPSLVAERGPELIVGRKTLAAMTQFRPDLVEQIIRFDHNRRSGFRLYDEGNLDELGIGMGTMGTDRNGETTTSLIEALQESRATNEQTLVVLSALTAEIHKGIGVRKYGTGGLVDEVIDGLYTTKKRNTSPMLRRLLGN